MKIHNSHREYISTPQNFFISPLERGSRNIQCSEENHQKNTWEYIACLLKTTFAAQSLATQVILKMRRRVCVCVCKSNNEKTVLLLRKSPRRRRYKVFLEWSFYTLRTKRIQSTQQDDYYHSNFILFLRTSSHYHAWYLHCTTLTYQTHFFNKKKIEFFSQSVLFVCFLTASQQLLFLHTAEEKQSL